MPAPAPADSVRKNALQTTKARGYDGELHFVQQWRWRWTDTLFVAGWTGFAVLCRVIDLPVVLGHLLSGA